VKIYDALRSVLQVLRSKKLAPAPDAFLAGALRTVRRVPSNRPSGALDQIGGDCDVTLTLGDAVLHRAHAVTDLEADVHNKARKAVMCAVLLAWFRWPVAGSSDRCPVRQQLAAPVAADRHQGQVLRVFVQHALPYGLQHRSINALRP